MLLASTKLWFFETRPHFLLLVSVLVGMALSCYASIALFVALGVLPLLALLGLVTTPLSNALIKGGEALL